MGFSAFLFIHFCYEKELFPVLPFHFTLPQQTVVCRVVFFFFYIIYPVGTQYKLSVFNMDFENRK